MNLIKTGLLSFKSNPLVNFFFILIIFLGILLLVMITIVGFSKETGTEVIEGNEVGKGYGHGVQKGDIIEVEYEIQGENVDVYLIKGYTLPFDNDDEDILVSKSNSQSGSITYEAKEAGMHMVYFNGYDFTVNYSYKVNKPTFSVFINALGFILIGSGFTGLWYYSHMPNPRYLGNYLNYLTVGFGILEVISIWLILINPTDFIVQYLTPFYIIIFGINSYYSGKVYNNQYRIRTPLRPEDCATKVKIMLDNKELKYNERITKNKRGKKWHAIYDLKASDISIRICKLYFSDDKSFVLIGKRNAMNKDTLIGYANDLAKDLMSKNYTPIPVQL